MTPRVNQTKLREVLTDLPEPARSAVRELHVTSHWKKLTEEWDPASLWDAANQMSETAEKAGFVNWAWGPLFDLTALRDRVRALPDDLRDMSSMNAMDAGVPSTNLPQRWTPQSWADAEAAISHAEGLADLRRRRVMAALDHATPPDTDAAERDALRHQWVSIVTNGRSESSKDLTGPEARHLASWAEACALTPEAKLTPFSVDWKAEVKRQGGTVGDMVDRAKEFCKQHELTKPTGTGYKALESIDDKSGGATGPWAHRVIAHLIGSADDGETMMETSADDHAEMDANAEEPSPDQVIAEVVTAVVEQTGKALADGATDAVLTELAEVKQRLATVEELCRIGLGLVRANAAKTKEALAFIDAIGEPLTRVLDRHDPA